MSRIADNYKGFGGGNPFKQSQARNYADDRVLQEFCPVSLFWDLFNEQHEILIGTRGSGKTILLKMMRYSLLKKLPQLEAKTLVDEKKFIAFYAPTNLEFLGRFSAQSVPDKQRILFFQFAYNCLLSNAFLHEVLSILDDTEDDIERCRANRNIAKTVAHIWFPEDPLEKFHSIDDLIERIRKMYYDQDVDDEAFLEGIPPVFKKVIATPVQSVADLVSQGLGLNAQPTWIACIDEAEFLSKDLQRCVNTIFRSDSRKVVIKMATLPFRHETKETLANGVFAEAEGNDFNYRLIDMFHDSADFINVTNSLCDTRLNRIDAHNYQIQETDISLEAYLGREGEDDLVDYFQLELGNKYDCRKKIELGILGVLSSERQKTNQAKAGTKSIRKSVYDKFAPIFFVRTMYKLSQTGNHIPGWYAGAKVIRKISNGNPRRFIQIMNDLFEQSKRGALTPKAQHKIIYKFCDRLCSYTRGLPVHGPKLSHNLEAVGVQLRERVHNGDLVEAGNSFMLKKGALADQQVLDSLELGVAYLCLLVDEDALKNGLSDDTRYTLANSFSAKYWLPMRRGGYPRCDLNYTPNPKKNSKQTELFFEGGSNE